MNRSLIAYCGSYCGACEWKEKIGCNGCKASDGNMFWGECTLIDGDSIIEAQQLSGLGVLALESVQPLEHSYVRLRYKVIS